MINILLITIGFVIAALACVYELLSYNLGKYFIGFADNTFSSTFCFAVLIIVISMLVDFGMSITHNLYKDAEQKILFQLACMDELTGLANRRRCEELMNEYKQSETTYAVISLDMNFLKKVNDTLGHEKGDEMIKRFADTLTDVFCLHGTVGRMGGDEFIAIIESNDRAEIEQLIEKFNEGVEEENKKNPELGLSISYGYAVNDELQGETPEKVYQLADKRMYECKKRKKLALQS